MEWVNVWSMEKGQVYYKMKILSKHQNLIIIECMLILQGIVLYGDCRVQTLELYEIFILPIGFALGYLVSKIIFNKKK